jgi:hypothetical protein
MVLMFSLQKHMNSALLSELISEMMTQAQKVETSVSMKAYLFIILEFLFSERKFDKQTLKKTISVMFNCEEILSEHLSNQVYVVSFLRAFLQLILNFYSQHPTEAKPYIPAFLGAVLELFADKGEQFQDLGQEKEVGLDSLGQDTHADPTREINQERNTFVSKNNYSGLAEQLFEMLVEYSFDAHLFSDLGSNPADELTDIFANFDFRKDVAHSSNRASTSSKIFALMNYALSERFSTSRSFICKMVLIMVRKIGSLEIMFSEAFHVNLAKMAGLLLDMGKSLKDADLLLGKIFELVDLKIAFEVFSKDFGITIENPSVLEKEEFSHIVYIFSRHCKTLDFQFFLNKIFPLLQHMAQKDLSQMTQIEEILLKKVYSSIVGFKNFESLWKTQDANLTNQVCHCLLSSLLPFSDQILDLQASFLSIFQSFLLSLLEVRDRCQTQYNGIVQNFRTINILGKFCRRVAQSDRNTLEENCLQLIVRLLPRDYINQVFEKNCVRLIKGLGNKDDIEKSLKESIILGFIARASGIVERDDHILFKMFSFIDELLQFKDQMAQDKNRQLRNSDKKKYIVKTNCLILQLLTFLTPNVPFSLYPRILEYACKTSREANVSYQVAKNSNSLEIEGQSNSKQTKEVSQGKYDQFALRFCNQLIASVQLNMTQANNTVMNNSNIKQVRMEMLSSLAEHFLPLVMVNIKSRNKKTRQNAKDVLRRLVELEHSGRNNNARIRVNSLSVSAVIAGLAGSSSYVKSCAVQGLGYLLKGFHFMFENDLKQSLLELVLMLTREKNKEIFLSVLKFFKTFVKLETGENIRKNKVAIQGTVFHEDCELGVHYRAKIKGILMILVRKLGRDETSWIVGEQWKNMIRYVTKKLSRTKSKRRIGENNNSHSNADLMEEEEDKEEITDFDVKIFLEERRKLVAERKRLANNSFNGFVGEIFRRYLAGSLGTNQESNTRIEEEAEEADDEEEFLEEFGDVRKLKEFFDEGIVKSKKKNKKTMENNSKKNKSKGDVYFDDVTGKLIITQKKIIPKLSGKRKFSDFETDESGLDSTKNKFGNLKRKRPSEFGSKKRREESESKYQRIIENVMKRNQHLSETVHTIQESGKSYRNKTGGGGDAAFRNRLTPHAFVQFNPVAISKKLRQKARKAFETVVNSRKKTTGALKNLKIKGK